jgi:hypothetical protein
VSRAHIDEVRKTEKGMPRRGTDIDVIHLTGIRKGARELRLGLIDCDGITYYGEAGSCKLILVCRVALMVVLLASRVFPCSDKMRL